MNRNTAAYNEAKWRVKISHFTEKGHDIKGVVHVGAHNGYEVQWYLAMGIENILCFEPLVEVAQVFKETYKKEIEQGKVKLFDIALGDQDTYGYLDVAEGDGQGSTFLKLNPGSEDKPYHHVVTGTQVSEIHKFASFMKDHPEIDLFNYDCLVIDAQGMELEVLKGMGHYLTFFHYLNIECSEKPIYKGEAPAYKIIEFLSRQGYKQDSPIEEHNDIMFIKDLVDPVIEKGPVEL